MDKKVDVHGGTIWTMIWHVLKMSLKFVSNIILTRLLTPEMYGIASIGNTIINGINMLSNLGIEQSVVRSHRNDDHFYQTAWTLHVLRGLILTVIIVLLAKPFAWFYEVDGLAAFLLIVAVSSLAMGFLNIEAVRVLRHANLRKLAIIDNVGTVLGLGIMVLWAWISPSYVALAVGSLATTTLFAIGTYLAFPRQNCRIHFDKEAMIDMISFGKWVLISTILLFATMQIDRLALGKLVTMHVIGLYSIAWLWASIPNQILEQWAHRVYFPLVSQYVRDATSMNTIWIVRRLYITIATVAAIVMYAVSDILVSILYSEQYQGVSLMIRQFSIVFLLYSIEASYSIVLDAQGRPKEKIFGQVLSIILLSTALLPVFYWADIAGVIALLALASCVRIIWVVYKIFTYKLAVFGLDIVYVGAYFPIAMLMHFIVSINSNRLYQVSAALVLGCAALIITLLIYRRLRRICA